MGRRRIGYELHNIQITSLVNSKIVHNTTPRLNTPEYINGKTVHEFSCYMVCAKILQCPLGMTVSRAI